MGAVCDTENLAPGGVLEKLDMQPEGTLRRWDVHPNFGDVPRDRLCYSAIREVPHTGTASTT